MEKRSRRISEEQWNVLLEFLEENPTIARGYNNTSQGRRESARLWQEVASRLNATGSGTSKSPKEWSVYVINYKGKLKKVVADINADASGTGGGPPRGSMLSDHDTRFLAILRPGFGQAAAQVRVDPFPNPVPQPSTSRPLPQPLIQEEFNIILEMEQEPVQDIAASTTLSPVGAAAISPLAQSPASGTAPPLPRRQRRTRIRSRPLAPLEEARRILSQVELQRAAADSAQAEALHLIAQNLGRLADNMCRLADASEKYLNRHFGP